MALLKSALILIFCISWASAADYDVNKKLDEIFNHIKGSLENAWKWIQIHTNNMNEIFSIHRHVEPRRYKYQNTQPSSVPTGSEKIDASTQTDPAPTPTSTTVHPEEPETVSVQSTVTPSQNDRPSSSSSPENPQPELHSLPEPEVKNEIQNELHAELPESQPNPGTLQQSGNEETQNNSAAMGNVEKETACEMTESPGNENEPQPQPDTQLGPLTPADNEIQGIPESQKNYQSSDKEDAVEHVEILKPAEIDRDEYVERVRKAGPSSAIYEQQNIIILFLFFLMLIMGIYFFLLSRAQHHCPTIVIGDLSGSLKPTFKK